MTYTNILTMVTHLRQSKSRDIWWISRSSYRNLCFDRQNYINALPFSTHIGSLHNHTILPNSSFKQWKLTGFGHCSFATDVQFWYGQLFFTTLNISELFPCTFVLNGLFKKASNSVATSAYQQNQWCIPFCMNAHKRVKYHGLDWVFKIRLHVLLNIRFL